MIPVESLAVFDSSYSVYLFWQQWICFWQKFACLFFGQQCRSLFLACCKSLSVLFFFWRQCLFPTAVSVFLTTVSGSDSSVCFFDNSVCCIHQSVSVCSLSWGHFRWRLHTDLWLSRSARAVMWPRGWHVPLRDRLGRQFLWRRRRRVCFWQHERLFWHRSHCVSEYCRGIHVCVSGRLQKGQQWYLYW